MGNSKSLGWFSKPLVLHIAGLSNTLNYDWDCACANEFPVAVEDVNGVPCTRTYIQIGKSTDKVRVQNLPTYNIYKEPTRCNLAVCGDTHITAHLLPLSATLPLTGSSLCAAPAKRPFSGAPASCTYSTGHAYRLCQLTNGRAGWPPKICIKEVAWEAGHSR